MSQLLIELGKESKTGLAVPFLSPGPIHPWHVQIESISEASAEALRTAHHEETEMFLVWRKGNPDPNNIVLL